MGGETPGVMKLVLNKDTSMGRLALQIYVFLLRDFLLFHLLLPPQMENFTEACSVTKDYLFN